MVLWLVFLALGSSLGQQSKLEILKGLSYKAAKPAPDLKATTYLKSDNPQLWSAGQILLSDGGVIQGLSIRYNHDIDLLEASTGGEYLKISSDKVGGFSTDNGIFRNGYIEKVEGTTEIALPEEPVTTYGFGISGKSSSKQVINLLEKIYGLPQAKIITVDLSQKKDKIKGRIIFDAVEESVAFQLQQIIKGLSFITDVDILESFKVEEAQEVSDDEEPYGEEAFFQVLVNGEFSLLKKMEMQEKIIVDALTLQQSTTEILLPRYFVADKDHFLSPIRRSKKSLLVRLRENGASENRLDRIRAHSGSVKREKELIELFKTINE